MGPGRTIATSTIRLAVERSTHHQEHAARIDPLRDLSDRVGGGDAEEHLFHLAEDNTSGFQHDVFSRRAYALERAPQQT